jgi:hypothetical protein
MCNKRYVSSCVLLCERTEDNKRKLYVLQLFNDIFVIIFGQKNIVLCVAERQASVCEAGLQTVKNVLVGTDSNYHLTFLLCFEFRNFRKRLFNRDPSTA